MCVREPCMYWKYCHFHAKTSREQDEHPVKHVERSIVQHSIFLDVQDIKIADTSWTAREKIDRSDAQQDEHRADMREDEELEGRLVWLGIPPPADDKVRRNQHEFPVEIEKQENGRDKNTDEASREHHQERIESRILSMLFPEVSW